MLKIKTTLKSGFVMRLWNDKSHEISIGYNPLSNLAKSLNKALSI